MNRVGLDDGLIFVGVLLMFVGVWLWAGWPAVVTVLGVMMAASGLALAWRNGGRA